MVEKLVLKNVGPAPEMSLEFAPRVNIITGDNGLGKSFILDVAWWASTGKWLSEMNSEAAEAKQLPPNGLNDEESKIFSLLSFQKKNYFFENEIVYDYLDQKWIHQGSGFSQAFVIYASVDGNYAVRDTSRTTGFRFNHQQLWDGLELKQKKLSNGLISDWTYWQLEDGEAFSQLQAALDILSPKQNEQLKIGRLTRIPDDPRNMPTIQMAYGQEVPIVLASAAVKRILSLAYILVWSWQEHLLARKAARFPPLKEMVLLIDELEQHLHPQWQRVILQSVLKVATTIMQTSDVQIQIIATTHSPLVMASLEPIFDTDQDAWFDLNLVNETVQLEKMPWRKRGGASAWLKSEAFDLSSDENVVAQAVLEKAAALFNASKVTKKKFLEIDTELRNVLGEMHPFWVRWQFWGEKKGWL